MSYAVEVLADSVTPAGARLTTLVVTFPRIVLAEFNTHRTFARNSASSRAIPVEKQIQRVLVDPFVPSYWGANQKGMQAEQEIPEYARARACSEWLAARDRAVVSAREMAALGVHKQITNRLLEPFQWHTVIVTATDWANFFALRCHKDAQPEIREAAVLMYRAMMQSAPVSLLPGDWHLPYIRLEDREDALCRFEHGQEQLMFLAEVSCARCARVSYLTHEGVRDLNADMALAKRLRESGHLSPFEHAAMALSGLYRHGPFTGWKQYRKFLPNEDVFVSSPVPEP